MKERLENNEARYVAVNESFGAAKEVKIGGLEQFYTERFSSPAETYAKSLATAITGQLRVFCLGTCRFWRHAYGNFIFDESKR